MFLGYIHAIAISNDGGTAIGGGGEVLIAHNTATCAVIWRKELSGSVWSLCIHNDVVVVPVNGSETVVLDISNGNQIHALPSAGEYVYGICVFDGLTCD